MALRFLPAIALAVLAVAWPAAVADGTASDPSSEPSDAVGPWVLSDPPAPFDPSTLVPSDPTTPPDPFTVAAFSAYAANQLAWMVGSELGDLQGYAMCRPYSITVPGPHTPVNEAVAVDPDGCLRTFVRRAIGWSYQVEVADDHLDLQAFDPFQPFP